MLFDLLFLIVLATMAHQSKRPILSSILFGLLKAISIYFTRVSQHIFSARERACRKCKQRSGCQRNPPHYQQFPGIRYRIHSRQAFQEPEDRSFDDYLIDNQFSDSHR